MSWIGPVLGIHLVCAWPSLVGLEGMRELLDFELTQTIDRRAVNVQCIFQEDASGGFKMVRVADAMFEATGVLTISISNPGLTPACNRVLCCKATGGVCSSASAHAMSIKRQPNPTLMR